MKKLINFSIIIILICLANSYAQPIPTISPCLTDYHSSGCDAQWVGPLFKTINTSNLIYTSFNCPTPPAPTTGCSFIVEYYTRTIDCPGNIPPVHAFDIQVVAVKPSDQCTECYNSNSDKIITELTYLLFEENASFFQNQWGASGDDCPHQNEIVTKGKCYHWINNQKVPCSNSNEVCCSNLIGICYSSSGHVINGSLTNWGRGNLFYNDGNTDPRHCNESPINCSDGISECKTNMIIYDQLNCPGISCESGEWKDGISEPMLIQGCGLSCQVRIHYIYRTNAECTPAWRDYRITQIEKIGNCSGCLNEMIISQGVNWVLQSGKLSADELQLNECRTNYRVINTKCWQVVNGILQECESPEWHCCTSIYQLCWRGARDPITNKQIYEITLLDQSSDWNIVCSAFPNCFTFCGPYPVRIGSEEEDNKEILPKYSEMKFSSYSHPNPTTGQTDIILKGDNNGTVNLKISDISGNIIYEINKIKNNQEIIFPLDLNSYSNGKYFYILSIDNIEISKGSINKNK